MLASFQTSSFSSTCGSAWTLCKPVHLSQLAYPLGFVLCVLPSEDGHPAFSAWNSLWHLHSLYTIMATSLDSPEFWGWGAFSCLPSNYEPVPQWRAAPSRGLSPLPNLSFFKNSSLRPRLSLRVFFHFYSYSPIIV